MRTQAIKQLFLLHMMDFIRCFISVLRRWSAMKQLLPICCAPTLSNSDWPSVPKWVIKNMDSPVNITINTEAAILTSFGSSNSTTRQQVCKLLKLCCHKPFWLMNGSGFPSAAAEWLRPFWTKQSSKYSFRVGSLR